MEQVAVGILRLGGVADMGQAVAVGLESVSGGVAVVSLGGAVAVGVVLERLRFVRCGVAVQAVEQVVAEVPGFGGITVVIPTCDVAYAIVVEGAGGVAEREGF